MQCCICLHSIGIYTSNIASQGRCTPNNVLYKGASRDGGPVFVLRISPGLHINPGIIVAINDRLFACYVTMRFKFPTKPRWSEIACLQAFGNAKLIFSEYSFQLCCFGNPLITNVAGSVKLTVIRAIIRYQHEEQPKPTRRS